MKTVASIADARKMALRHGAALEVEGGGHLQRGPITRRAARAEAGSAAPSGRAGQARSAPARDRPEPRRRGRDARRHGSGLARAD